MIEELQASDPAAEEPSPDGVSVLQRAAQCAAMLEQAAGVEDAPVQGFAPELADAVDSDAASQLDNALRHLSQCSQSQHASQQAAELASPGLRFGNAQGRAADVHLTPLVDPTRGLAEVPTPPSAATPPQATLFPPQTPPATQQAQEVCGMRPLNAGRMRALSQPLENKRPAAWDPAPAAGSRRTGRERRLFGPSFLQHLLLAGDPDGGWSVATQEQQAAAKVAPGALPCPADDDACAAKHTLVVRPRPDWVNFDDGDGSEERARMWDDGVSEYKYALLLCSERPCPDHALWQDAQMWCEVLFAMLEVQLASMSSHFDEFARDELVGGRNAGMAEAVRACHTVMNLICDNTVNESQLGHGKQRARVSPNADVLYATAARAMEKNGFWEWLAQAPGLFEVLLPHALLVRSYRVSPSMQLNALYRSVDNASCR